MPVLHKRVVIFDPSVAGEDRTHNLQSIIGFTHFFEMNCIETFWVTNKNCNCSVMKGKCFPLFDYTVYDDVRGKNICQTEQIRELRYEELVLSNESIMRNIISELDLTFDDHVFFQNMDWLLFSAILKLFSSNNRSKLPVFHMYFLYEEADWMTGKYPYQKIIQGLREIEGLGENVFIYTETKAHAKKMALTVGKDIAHSSFPVKSVVKNRSKKEIIHIGTLGGGRADKGFDMLPDIVKLVNSMNHGKFKIQFNVQAPRPEDNLDEYLEILLTIGNVNILPNVISQLQYDDHLKKNNLLIFPYSAKTYNSRGSGALFEALANKTPFICMKNSSLEENITHNNGLAKQTANDFASGILEIISSLDDYNKRAQDAAKAYVEFQKMNPITVNIINGG